MNIWMEATIGTWLLSGIHGFTYLLFIMPEKSRRTFSYAWLSLFVSCLVAGVIGLVALRASYQVIWDTRPLKKL